MPNTLIATRSIDIAAAPERVWQALTDPALVKQIMFGSEVVSDWKKGGSIVYRGVWEGKPYEDKGTILDIEPTRLLRTTYYSPLSGKPDVPENYDEVTYALAPQGAGTRLTVSQTNIADEAGKARMEGNWGMVLDSIKKLIEA
jgi:uncharacterized protein YndB with AHSA1/START domain